MTSIAEYRAEAFPRAPSSLKPVLANDDLDQIQQILRQDGEWRSPEGTPEDSGQITYSLYLTYLEEIEELQAQQKNVGQEQEDLAEELIKANAKLDTLGRSLYHREVTSVDVHKQIFEDSDAMDFMENKHQEELRALRAENEEVNLLKHRVTGRITDANNEAEGLKTLIGNIESKLIEVQEELDNIKAAKALYDESSQQEKDQMKNQVQKLLEKNKDLSKAVDSVTTEIASKSKTQKHLEITFQKTKEELRSLAKQFSKKQERENALENDRKNSLFAGVIAGGAPTGEVTLVFSSVDGSKELWEMFPTAMTLAIDMHNNILKNRIKSAGGYEVKSDGDSFMVAFSDVLTGLQYCMLVQEDLLGATWPQEILSSQYAAEKLSQDGRVLFCGLRCRMGLHVGKPQCRPNPVTGRMDYLGSMVNKSARVAGLAHGGQVFASDAAVKHLFEIKDENCRVYLSQLGIRMVGTFPLRGIQGEEKITEILPHTLRDRQFAAVGVDLPQSPTAKAPPANPDVTATAEGVPEHETPGAQFAKFAEIHEPLPHAPAPSNLTSSSAPGVPVQPPSISPPLSQLASSQAPQPSLPSQSSQSSQPHATHVSSASLSVSIPSPSDTPIPSPSGNFLESMASMEYLTNSLLTSMAITTSSSTHSISEGSGGDKAKKGDKEKSDKSEKGEKGDKAEKGKTQIFAPPPIISHPDDAIQKKYEEKLKTAEEKLIFLKSDLARVKTEKDDFREKLKGLKEKEKILKAKLLQEGSAAQEKQQDLAKMAFEKLHANQLLDQANLNITSIRILLKNLEEKIVQTTASRDHARNAYHHWDKMMKLCSQEVLTFAKRSTQLEAEWTGLRNGKIAYFNSAKGLETKINQGAAATNAAAQSSESEGMVIEQVLEYHATETDVTLHELFYKEKAQENEALKTYVQQLTNAIIAAEENPARSFALTKELAEKTVQQEQQLQKLTFEKQKQQQEVHELHKMYIHEVSQQHKALKTMQSEVETEIHKTREIKSKFGGAVADKYQEVVQHVQVLEKNQKLASTKEREGGRDRKPSMSRSMGAGQRSLMSSMDRSAAAQGESEARIGRSSGYHSTHSLLDSGSNSLSHSQRKESLGSSGVRGGIKSPTERERGDSVSIRNAKPFSSTASLIGERTKGERGNETRNSREELPKGVRSSLEDGGAYVGERAREKGNKEEANTNPEAKTRVEGESKDESEPSKLYSVSTLIGERPTASMGERGSKEEHHGKQNGTNGERKGETGERLEERENDANRGEGENRAARRTKGERGSREELMDRDPVNGVDGNKLGSRSEGEHRISREKAMASFSSSGSGSNDGERERDREGREGRDGRERREREKGFDFRSIALVQNELANRLADARQLEAYSLDNTRDQMATLSRLMKGTKGDDADLSIIGTGVDAPSVDKQQRISMSLLRLMMQIRPDAYRKSRNQTMKVDDLKVSGQRLHL